MRSRPGLPGDDDNERKFIEMNERERSPKRWRQFCISRATSQTTSILIRVISRKATRTRRSHDGITSSFFFVPLRSSGFLFFLLLARNTIDDDREEIYGRKWIHRGGLCVTIFYS